MTESRTIEIPIRNLDEENAAKAENDESAKNTEDTEAITEEDPDPLDENTAPADDTPDIETDIEDTDLGSDMPEKPERNWEDLYLRARAELDTATRTIPKRIQEGIDRFKRSHFNELIEVADGFERGLEQVTEAAEAWQDGIRSLHRMFLETLAKSGLSRIRTTGENFDPALHEVVSTLAAPGKKDGEILAETRSGWTLDGKLLRAAMVVVVKNEE